MSVEPDKWGVIYNPKAGTRKVQKRWKEIKAYMDSKGVSYDYVQSEGFGSVERLAGILANNGYRTIVVVGGDGALKTRSTALCFPMRKIKRISPSALFPTASEMTLPNIGR